MKDFLEYLRECGIVLTERGGRWWASCPFHADTNPSFTVSKKGDGYVWYCYSCKRGGGAVEFISEFKQIPKFEARREWKKLNGETFLTERETINSLFDDLPYCDFLKERGITAETAARFRVGYVENYDRWLAEHQLPEATARECGIFPCSNCVVYPFYDEDGVYKMASRPVDHKEYKTSREDSRYFKRGMWGWHLVRSREVYVFEGYHDVMVAVQSGLQALCACGTEIHADGWAEMKRRGIEKIVVCPDGDLGGRGWLERIVRSAPRDLSMELVVLKSGDPDDAILAGDFLSLKRWNPFEWYLTDKYGSVQDVAEKCAMLKESRDVYTRMPEIDRVVAREWYAKAFGSDEALYHLKTDEYHDINAERMVIANALCSKNARLDALRELQTPYFTGEFLQSVFDYIRDNDNASLQMVLTLFGQDFSTSVDLLNYAEYIDMVRRNGESTQVRRILDACDPSNVSKIVEDLYKVTDHVEVKDGSDLVRSTLEAINSRVGDPSAQGVEIRGFPILNHTLLGWNVGKLVLLSGNSGHGKTTAACNFLDGVVDDYGCAFFSLEMTEGEIMERLLTIRSGVPASKIATGSLEQFEYDKVAEASASLMHGNLQVITKSRELHKIVALAKALILRKGVRFVFIDYIQLVTMKSRAERWEQLAEITQTLKNQLCSLGATVIALTQLKRSALQSNVPDANEQAGAYAMVADADVALAVAKRDPSENPSNYVLNVSKNRFGWDEVAIDCDFDRNCLKIKELTL